ncbi:putative formate dehydrogenase protein [Botrytis fragariae]|uniref:Putative formate dehydrogenase protein n=1 Tax=Botrytis fragariae TaxID=1964551 RepID=A0A8H6B5G5_9HELO|nr:putative formate dehydrogenase protein [Botrytis fragariae]KAF5879307.1 putative formate dehydrogenase protein [Botrytis fragariae]
MSVDIQQRQARNIGFGAFILLIIIWTVKLSSPNHDAINFYSNHTKSLNSSKLAFSLPNLFSGDNSNATTQANLVTDEFGDYFNGTIFNKVAVIIEDSYRPDVIPLVLHFGSVLGPTWPILIYTSIEDVARFSTSAALSRYLKQGLIQIRNLPQTVLFTDLKARNKFMTDTWLWENLAPAEHILLFDSDSMLCSNAATSVDDFFAYDLVGTPVKDKGHRGGLSMRKRSSMLRDRGREEKKRREKKKEEEQKKKEEAQKKKSEEEKKKKMDQEIKKKLEDERNKSEVENQEVTKKEEKGKQVDKEAQVNGNRKENVKQNSKREKKEEEEEPEEELAEDRWYQEKLRKLQGDEENIGIDPEEDGAVNMPTEEVTRTFSVESIDYPHPLGLHRVHKWKEDQMDKLLDWCPEYRLCSVSHHGKEFPTFANGGVGW